MRQSDKPEFQSPTELLTGGDDNAWLKRGLEIARQADSLQQHWQRAAGELAEHSRLIHIEPLAAEHIAEAADQVGGPAGVGVIFADSAAWASRIRSVATRLTSQLNQSLQTEPTDAAISAVTAIRVRIQPVEEKFGDRTKDAETT